MSKKNNFVFPLAVLILNILILVFLVGCVNNKKVSTKEEIKLTKKIEENEENVLHIATGEWAPYVYESEDDLGFLTVIVRRSFENSGIHIKLHFDSWARNKEIIDSKKVFASYPWYYIEENFDEYKVTLPLVNAEERLLYLKSNTKVPKTYKKLSDLNFLTVGGIRGYSHMKIYSNCDLESEVSSEDINAIKNIYYGRTDILAINPLVAKEIIKKEFPDEINKFDFIEKPIIEFTGIGLLINKDYPDADKYINLFNEGFKELVESGEYEKILKDYNIDEKYSIKNN